MVSWHKGHILINSKNHNHLLANSPLIAVTQERQEKGRKSTLQSNRSSAILVYLHQCVTDNFACTEYVSQTGFLLSSQPWFFFSRIKWCGGGRGGGGWLYMFMCKWNGCTWVSVREWVCMFMQACVWGNQKTTWTVIHQRLVTFFLKTRYYSDFMITKLVILARHLILCIHLFPPRLPWGNKCVSLYLAF